MDIILIVFLVWIVSIIGVMILLKVTDNDYLKLLKWSSKINVILLACSLIFSIYTDYHVDKSLDIVNFGVFDFKQFFLDYLLVMGNLLILGINFLIKIIVARRGIVNNWYAEQQFETYIMFYLIIWPIANILLMGYLAFEI
ncbi:hypothetical protein [Chengkuizengella marina]|uniref:Uncharacterized protein n=1 Tax=Chengkuizengella marina TaxID=2507566 RepID=A0A6N9Q129_9BACL|nr:hypothetical protein [Chengkuizengella marina]NBI29047.1 hypothetical protein [Chengkuizengella marina]